MLLSFSFICLPVWYFEWLVSIILSSGSPIHSSVSFSLLFLASKLVFILVVQFSNFHQFIFIVSITLSQWSALLSVIFLNFFLTFLSPHFWTWSVVDWWGLFHYLFFQGISLVLSTGSRLFCLFILFKFFCLYEFRRNSYLFWFWRSVFMWEHLCIAVCPIFSIWGLILVWMSAISFLGLCWTLSPWWVSSVAVCTTQAGCAFRLHLCSKVSPPCPGQSPLLLE